MRRRLGTAGVWLAPQLLRTTPADVQRRELRRIEEAGYGSVWTGEPPLGGEYGGNEIFAQLAIMLGSTERIVVGAGIANMRLRSPLTMQAGGATLEKAHPGRLILGLGGFGSGDALSETRDYLDRMDEAYEDRFPRVLAAVGPKMTRLGGERTLGVHPFHQPVAQTRLARAAIGPDALLIPEQAVILDTDAARARESVRALYRPMRQAFTKRNPYDANYLRLGFTADDVDGDRSDRLIDAVFAHGDERAVAARVREHLDAGADHVLLAPAGPTLRAITDDLLRLAPALRDDR